MKGFTYVQLTIHSTAYHTFYLHVNAYQLRDTGNQPLRLIPTARNFFRANAQTTDLHA